MKSANGVVLLLSLGLASFSADAAIYMCKDANGRTITSDQPIPECAKRSMRELGSNGVVKREIPAPITPEERRRREAEEAKKKEEAAALEARQKADRALMARFRNEKDIETARKRELETIQDEIKREELSKADIGKQLKQAQTDADGYKKQNKRTPADLEHKIDDSQTALEESNKLLEEHHQEMDQVNARYDETLKRYREILGGEQASR
jgi:hypothetical protein